MYPRRLGPVLSLLFGVAVATGGTREKPEDRAAPFAETGGLVVVEAEDYHEQTVDQVRRWERQRSDDGEVIYLVALPDTRRTPSDPLVEGENYAPRGGAVAVLHYRVHFSTPGRYYIWVRSLSTGTEDNGLHVGINGTWPATGLRMQWCTGKRRWWWESKQRGRVNHCGDPHTIYLDIPSAGVHTITFSMREDGFRFDRWLATRDRDFPRLDAAVGPPASHRHGDR